MRLNARLAVLVLFCAVVTDRIAQASPALTLQDLVPTSREAPQEFGVGDYVVTTIPAVAFTAQSSDTSFVPPFYTSINDMSRFFLMESGTAEIYAPVTVPAG